MFVEQALHALLLRGADLDLPGRDAVKLLRKREFAIVGARLEVFEAAVAGVARGLARVSGLHLVLPCVGPSILATAARIEGVTQAVAEEVECEDDRGDREARVDGERRRGEDVLLRALEHVAPRRQRRLHAQSEVAERRLGEDRERDAERRG